PSRHAEVCPAIVGVKRLELWADLYVLVGPNVVGSPDFLTGRCIERRDPAAHTHLATARTDDHFSFHHYRRHRDRLATRQIAHPRAPQLASGRGIDGDGVTIQQVVENLSVGVRSAAIHYVAAGSSDRLLCIVRTELPLERLSRLRQVNRVRDVGIWSDDVHRVTNNEWLSFVPAQHASRERPRYFEIRRILRSDRGELTIAGARVGTSRHLPFARGSR